MGYLPDGNAQVQDSQARHSAAKPAGSDRVLQALKARLVRRIDQKIVAAPIAQAKRRIPGQQREHQPHFKAQQNVEDDAQPGSHIGQS